LFEKNRIIQIKIEKRREQKKKQTEQNVTILNETKKKNKIFRIVFLIDQSINIQ